MERVHFIYNCHRPTIREATQLCLILTSIIYPDKKPHKDHPVRVFVIFDQDIYSTMYLNDETKIWENTTMYYHRWERRTMESYLIDFFSTEDYLKLVEKASDLHSCLKKLVVNRVSQIDNEVIIDSDVDAWVQSKGVTLPNDDSQDKILSAIRCIMKEEKSIEQQKQWFAEHKIPWEFQSTQPFENLFHFADGHKMVSCRERKKLFANVSTWDETRMPDELKLVAKKIVDFVLQ